MDTHMKKEKHPVYRLILSCLILLLALGVVLLVLGLRVGGDWRWTGLPVQYV